MIRNLALLTLLFLLFQSNAISQAIKVEVKEENGKWTLYRGGQPYYIKGGGGSGDLDLLVKSGGNSIRTWSYEGAQEVLDEAHSKGLTVCLGLWLGHERHGFDYDDEWAVKGQLENFRNVVDRFKDHPALLLWGIGNEMDLFYSNFKVWDAVSDIAKMIKEVDPNHPTMTVTAGLDVAEVKLIQQRAPEVDILGINTYGELPIVPKKVKLFGWNKAYAITEWGPNGFWEVAKTDWDVSIEQTSGEKAISYATRYDIIEEDKGHCIGSYVFLWGHKQEHTSTWFGLFDENGMPTEVIDAVAKGWSGEWPENRAPAISNFTLDGKTGYDNIYLDAGTAYIAEAEIMDHEGDKLDVRWELVPESTDKRTGGDAEAKPMALSGYISKIESGKVSVKMPKEEGAYRLFVYASDGNGLSYANWPFYVKK